MIRRLNLVNVASLLSLMLCMATATLWARSCFRHDAVVLLTPRHETRAVSDGGRLMIRRSRESHNERLAVRWSVFDAYGSGSAGETDRWWNRLGFAARGNTYGVPGLLNPAEWTIEIPHWTLVLPLILPPLLWLRWFVRRRTRREGVCSSCGYDLRASTDRCPECGTPIHQKGKAAT